MKYDTIPARLDALRNKMKEFGIAGCLIPTDDDHMSEYVCSHWMSREFFSGFTGSAGTLVVLRDRAALWTDGRYHLQAGEQLAGTGISLMKDGLAETPKVRDWLAEYLPEGSTFAFDGRCLDAKTGLQLKERLAAKAVTLAPDFDPAEGIWEDRPAMPDGPAELFQEPLAGESAAAKLTRIRAKMERENADALLLTKLDEIAWLLNMRGSDIDYNPVFLAFLTVEKDGGTLYIDPKKLREDTLGHIAALGFSIRPYEAVYEDAVHLSGQRVMASMQDLNYLLYESLTGVHDEDFHTGGNSVVLLDRPSPVLAAKSVKSETETENNRRTHVQDGAAMVRFMKWLKELKRGEDGLLYEAAAPVTELSAAAHLDALRAAIPGYRELSFPTISGYAAHGAVIHYEATEETDIPLAAKGLFLVDSGGHYDGGTTDITRTFAMGPLTDEEKEHFALVLRAMLALMNARFPEGVCFENLDVLARLPLWERGLDYLHGTGHGVGHVLNVHEGPNRFHWRPAAGKGNTKIEPGMVTTDEPGVYIDGKHGIRLENELLCVPASEILGSAKPDADTDAKYGRFLGFECLTLCPIDLDAVDPKHLDGREIAMLNAYHAYVYDKLAPLLTEEEQAFLKEYTRPVRQ